MPAIDKPKAEELLAQLQQHQANQAQCLRNLLGLPSENAAEEKREAAGKVMGGEKSPGMSSETAGTVPKISRDEKTEMPADWALPWSNALLRKRIDERRDEPGCAGGLRRYLSDVDAADPAVRFITANALTDLTRFTFERDFQFLQDPSDFDQAFSVTDFDEKRQITLDTRTNLKLMKDKENELQRVLFSQRTLEKSVKRRIIINAFTPSALSTVLLCASKDRDHDFTTVYAALRRHLSTNHVDRHYNEGHGFERGKHIVAFTIPYFTLTDHIPAEDCAPLSHSGIFGIGATGTKHIREEKFSMTWVGGMSVDEPSLMIVLSPLDPNDDVQGRRMPVVSWIRNNIFMIAHMWGEVLDSLDEQTTLPSSVTFDDKLRQGILFEDRNFTNSKTYFWALQSLRLFAEHIDGTLRSLPNIFISTNLADDRLSDYDEVRKDIDHYKEKFTELRDRIERKRQEIQSLSDSLFSASSVAEGRLAAEQNGNIRLLTLVTIFYLPLTLATSIYGMNALPKKAGLVSFFIVTIIIASTTYVMVFNLRHIKDVANKGRLSMHRKLRHWQKGDLKPRRTDSGWSKSAA